MDGEINAAGVSATDKKLSSREYWVMRREELLQASERAAHSSTARRASPTSAESSLGTIQSWLFWAQAAASKAAGCLRACGLTGCIRPLRVRHADCRESGCFKLPVARVGEPSGLFDPHQAKGQCSIRQTPRLVFSPSGYPLPLSHCRLAAIRSCRLGLSGAIMLIGLYVQISAKVILGRSFGLIAANRGIKVEGPYRIVRHPSMRVTQSSMWAFYWPFPQHGISFSIPLSWLFKWLGF